MIVEKYKYQFDKSSKKFECPACGKKRFVKYRDSETNEYLPSRYGKCDRLENCTYHLNPYKDDYGKQYQNKRYLRQPISTKPKQKSAINFIPEKVMQQTLGNYQLNNFINNLLQNIAYPFKVKDMQHLIELYYLGTISKGKYAGATTFPFIDLKGKIRAIQAKSFNLVNNTTETNFLHAIAKKEYNYNENIYPFWLKQYLTNERKVSCLFGEHLLNQYPYNPVALVEAPKTALYGALYFGLPNSPDKLLWLAAYNLTSLNYIKCKVLQGRKVILYPDASTTGNAYKLWSAKANEFNRTIDATFMIDKLLETNATSKEKAQGYDLADYLIKFDWRHFRN